MSTVSVHLQDRSFTLRTDKSYQYVQGVEQYVNEKVEEVQSRRNSKVHDERALLDDALLACLMIADDYYSLKEELEEYKKELSTVSRLLDHDNES